MRDILGHALAAYILQVASIHPFRVSSRLRLPRPHQAPASQVDFQEVPQEVEVAGAEGDHGSLYLRSDWERRQLTKYILNI